MKGISPIVGAVLIIAITISAIFLAFNMGGPAVDRAKEVLIMQEGKSILLDVKNSVNSVLTEGNMSTRLLEFRIIDGNLKIDEDNDAVIFSMNTQTQIIGVGISKIEDGINITGSIGLIQLNLTFDNVDVIGSLDMGKGTRKLTIRNEGYDSILQKQTISFS
ncbi:MAG: archaellin/type IV pilin N-terminal domain-containing protein [Candidatus Heimdallarchaeaceae archaeon]|jgi:flagellin-like protein